MFSALPIMASRDPCFSFIGYGVWSYTEAIGYAVVGFGRMRFRSPFGGDYTVLVNSHGGQLLGGSVGSPDGLGFAALKEDLGLPLRVQLRRLFSSCRRDSVPATNGL